VRDLADVDAVAALAQEGMSSNAVARSLGIPRETVRRWLARGIGDVRERRLAFPQEHILEACPLRNPVPPDAYAYLLGMYLGDGHIATHPRGVYRLRITCCNDYPAVMDECADALSAVLPGNRVGRLPRVGCTDVNSYSKHWPCLLPQHGEGRKHTRTITLEPWQQRIVDAHPKLLLRGLLHSDGCRSLNSVRVGDNVRVYPRYLFSNVSDDIRGIFCATCDALGIEWRQNRWNSISVARRASVAMLDSFVGPKA
jgi:hypothetical protein